MLSILWQMLSVFPTTREEIEDIISSLKTGKATGPSS
jgi:hypothetical protein